MARAPAVQEQEPVPEVERLEGLPHPRETQQLFGHEPVEAMLAQTLMAGRMHHAWLLAGPLGIGKATLAYRLARFALATTEERAAAQGPLGIAPGSTTARLVNGLAHPGLLVIRRPWDPRGKRFPATIPIDEVRRLRGFLARTAEAGAWRVVIVDSADELNVNAANALLKLLEEPPRDTLFLLVTRQAGRLLPTIRSRCRTAELAALPAAALRAAVDQAITAGEAPGPNEADWASLERLADGSVRRALELETQGGLKLYERIDALVARLPELDWTVAHALADELASPAAEQRMELFFDLLLTTVARLVRVAGIGAGSAQEQALADRLIPPSRLASWAELWETIVRDKSDTLALNLDRRMLVLETLGRLERLTRD